jgi:hypothetical protein
MQPGSQSSPALFLRLLPLSLMQVLTGCLYTGPMWQDANERLATEPRTFGIIEGDSADAGGTERLLVIRYFINAGEELYATIPLTREGCPVEPFAYTGQERRPERIVDALPDAQRRQLAGTRLVLHDARWAKQLEGAPRFRRLNWQTDGASVPYDAGYGGDDRGGKTSDCRIDVRVLALRVGRPWTEAEDAAMPLPVGSPIEYPQDACVLGLPYAQPRPERHRQDAQWRAALLTPVTLVGDAVVVPLIYIACYGFGLCP